MNNTLYSIFKKGSKTYFYSSIFFPKKVKEDVFTLYSFVRTADDFVDSVPQQKKGFIQFKKNYEKAIQGKRSGDLVIDGFCGLCRRMDFRREWIRLFLKAMEMDLFKKRYFTLAETKEYMVGSAEVIGLMMARIMGLPDRSFSRARLLGRSMQYINFIRDIREDRSLGRTYLPLAELKKAGLKSLEYQDIIREPEKFRKFIQSQLDIYSRWQKEAEKGYRYIPKRYLVPVKTASEMYQWTAETIRKDPFVVFRKKVKPPFMLILYHVIRNMLGGWNVSRP
ncbi:MAG: phytoene/squalene synthase family protein [bacterium]|nr:phytoene/squalene synthase family protein [bacterium]